VHGLQNKGCQNGSHYPTIIIGIYYNTIFHQNAIVVGLYFLKAVSRPCDSVPFKKRGAKWPTTDFDEN
jgi:hypothetical protein